MSQTTDPWFVTERSEALAGLILTSRHDLRVRKERGVDDLLILHVEIDTGDPLLPALFVVQVKGTTSADPDEWLRNVQHKFSDPNRPIYLPVCVFVVNVRDNKAFFSWLVEPHVEGERASLLISRTPDFHPLDPVSVSKIVEQVKGWYAALPGTLQAA